MSSSRTPLAAALLALLVIAGPAAAAPRPVQATGETRHGRGRMRTVEGVRFLTLNGTWFEMGEQYGFLMKDRMGPALAALHRSTGGQDRRAIERRLSTRYRELLRGIAAGLGATADDVLRLVLELPPEESSTILAKIGGVPVGQGTLLHARNLDLPVGPLSPVQVIVEFQPEFELRFVATAAIGVSDGMNERGITVTASSGPACASPSRARSRPAPGPEISGVALDILGTARSLTEAERVLIVSEEVSALLAVGSVADQDAVVYDLACGARRKNGLRPEGPLFATNRFLHPELTSPEALRACPRYRRLEEDLGHGRPGGLDDVMAALGDAGTGYGPNNGATRRSVVFDAKARVLRVAMQGSFAAWGRWLEYDWRHDRTQIRSEPLCDVGEVALRSRPAEKVARIRELVRDRADQSAFWREIEEVLTRAGMVGSSAGYTVYWGKTGALHDVEVVQPVLALPFDSGRVNFRTTPAVELASVRHYGPHRTLAAAYAALAAWMDEHGYAASGPPRETYLRADPQSDPRRWETQVEIPVSQISRIPRSEPRSSGP